ncbi:hypothetical protein LJB99_06525 [Deltaproteobacteria bacterium OttesenSCG-928-K17]|nr:hypothetical protein [Deltaproteobacteria bacterium OttesenSCG-928-K17]
MLACNKSSIKKRLLRTVVLLLLLYGCILSVVFFSGYEREDKLNLAAQEEYDVADLHLTTQEKFDIVVAGIVNDKRIMQHTVCDYTVNEAGERVCLTRLVKNYKYSSVEEFYAINPNCCVIVDDIFDGERSFYVPQKLKKSGKLDTIINVSYVSAFDELNSNRPIKSGTTFGLSRSGQLYSLGEMLNLIDPNWE